MSMLVVGLGNVLLSDEGIGVHIVNALRNRPLPPSVRLMDGATIGVDLLEDILSSDRVIIVDSARMGIGAGEHRTFDVSNISDSEFPNYSLHDISLPETLKLGEIVGSLPPILIVGIQPKSIEPGNAVTDALSTKFNDYVEHVWQTILDFNEEAVN